MCFTVNIGNLFEFEEKRNPTPSNVVLPNKMVLPTETPKQI